MLEYPPILTGTPQEQLRSLRDYLVRRVREQEASAAGRARVGAARRDEALDALRSRLDRAAGTVRRDQQEDREQTGAFLSALLTAPEEPGPAAAGTAAPAAAALPGALRWEEERERLRAPGLALDAALSLGENWLLTWEDGPGLRCLGAEQEATP